MTDAVNVTEEMIRAGMGWREVDENENITDPTASMVARILYAGLAAAPKAEAVSDPDLKWHRLGDVLPEQRSILIASKREGEDFWRVRDAVMQVRYEGVFPHVSDLANGNRPVTWWFDCIYPGKGDMRLAHQDLLWAYMPTPDDHPAPASDELLSIVKELRDAGNGLFVLKNNRGDYGYFDDLADRIIAMDARLSQHKGPQS